MLKTASNIAVFSHWLTASSLNVVYDYGITEEYPYLYYYSNFPNIGYNSIIKAGIVIYIKSYISKRGGTKRVKLEQQVLITNTGIEVLSKFPFKQSML
jgi:Xaa-Pro aminopeptidase